MYGGYVIDRAAGITLASRLLGHANEQITRNSYLVTADAVEVQTIGTGDVQTIRLNRPEEGNSLDLEMAMQLRAAVTQMCADAACRVVIIDSVGDLFCGGGDVRAMSDAADPGRYSRELADTVHAAFLELAHSPIVVVCAVQGAAAGIGLAVVLNADYVLASERSVFLAAYGALGVSPDGGTTYLLPRVVGLRRASELCLTSRRLDAQTAEEWGIVNRVVPHDQLESAASKIARDIARTPKSALSATKHLLSKHWLHDYAAQLDAEAASISALIISPDSRDLQRAFLDRAPRSKA